MNHTYTAQTPITQVRRVMRKVDAIIPVFLLLFLSVFHRCVHTAKALLLLCNFQLASLELSPKYHLNIIQILPKYCPNVVQMLFKYNSGVAQNLLKFRLLLKEQQTPIKHMQAH